MDEFKKKKEAIPGAKNFLETPMDFAEENRKQLVRLKEMISGKPKETPVIEQELNKLKSSDQENQLSSQRYNDTIKNMIAKEQQNKQMQMPQPVDPQMAQQPDDLERKKAALMRIQSKPLLNPEEQQISDQYKQLRSRMVPGYAMSPEDEEIMANYNLMGR